MSSGASADASLQALLVAHQAAILRIVSREAAGLLRYESDDDLLQGVFCRALAEGESFQYLGELQFFSWVTTVVRHHAADRHDYWTAIKRGSGRVLRLTFGGTGTADPRAHPVPAGEMTGASTFASRREMLVVAAKALAVLSPRDRRLVEWMSEGIDLTVQAERLGLTYAAVQRAGRRAVDRFRKTFRLALNPPKSR